MWFVTGPLARTPGKRLRLLAVLLLGCASDDARDDADTDLTACPDMPVSECLADRCMVLTGIRADATRTCVIERRAFCLDGIDVHELVTAAVDPDGARWLFGSPTLPPNWTAAAPEEGDADAFGWDECAEGT